VEYDYDTVIVGGGVAGALTAWSLSQGERPPRILILEAGDNRLDGEERAAFVDAYMRAPSKGSTSPYNELPSAKPVPSPESGSDPAVLNRYFVEAGPDLYKSNYLRVLGGSTWTWRGNTPRFIYNDFRLKELYGVGEDWPLTYDDLESWYCEAERELGVSGNDEEWDGLLGSYRTRPFPMPGISPSYGDKLIMKAIDGLEIDARPVQITGILRRAQGAPLRQPRALHVVEGREQAASLREGAAGRGRAPGHADGSSGLLDRAAPRPEQPGHPSR
jgi:choline dehydrogenase-like flavoprotein